MLLTIQFPIADSRKFISGSRRLGLPGWPHATPDSEFIRYFGMVRARNKGGPIGWGSDEFLTCNALQAFQYGGNLEFRDPAADLNIPLRGVFRRFYSDGYALGKFEVGIGTKTPEGIDLSKAQTKGLIEHFLGLPIRVKNPGGKVKNGALGHAGKRLTSLYVQATTKTGKDKHSKEPAPPLAETPREWVHEGTPLLFLDHLNFETIDLPYESRKIPFAFHDMALIHCVVPYDGQNLELWTLQHNDANSGEVKAARALRLYLIRLHAEHECLRFVLRNITNGAIDVSPLSKLSDDLQRYFDDATSRVFQAETRATALFQSEDVIEIARASSDFVSPEEAATLLEGIKRFQMRRNVERKSIDYINVNVGPGGVLHMGEQNTISGGDFRGAIVNFKSTLTDVTQTVGALPTADEDTKKQLQDLVAKLSEELAKVPPAQVKDAQTVSEITKVLVDQANVPEPNHSLLQITGDGLKKAAENLAAVMPTVLPIAAQIVGFILKLGI